MGRVSISIITTLLMISIVSSFARAETYNYKTPEQIQKELKTIVSKNKDVARLHTLAVTPGKRDLSLLELGAKDSQKPAILVIANAEADYPISSEAALDLAGKLTGEWKDRLDANRWFIIPCFNPDGYANYFTKPLVNNFGNAKAVNKDNDDATDEDGPDDLNSDGFITLMRQKHPEGKWLPVDDNPLLLRKADKEKAEVGMYRLMQEGIDNDGDGDINEDGPGGINPGRNFPHEFNHHTRMYGLWAASEAESEGLLRFAFDHPEIAMVVVLGRNNTIKEVPPSNNRSQSTKSKYKLPGWMARRLGLDPEEEYPLKDLVEMGREMFGNPNLDEDMVMQYLGAGAAVNPNKNDLTYWTKITEEYKEFIEEAGLPEKRLASPGFKSGNVAEWAYYQFGVPTFCMDFWTIPEVEEKAEESADSTALTPEKLEGMSNEEFLALGEEKIAQFLKDSGTPAQYNAKMVIEGIKGGMMNTKRMAKMIRKMKKEDEGGGVDETETALFASNPDAFVAWTAYDHPTLGEVEIGGMKPYSTVQPPAKEVDSLIEKQLPFVLKLTDNLPQLTISKVSVEKRSSGVYSIEVWIKNIGLIPYPTYQGKRCQRPIPAIVTIEGASLEVLEGKNRYTIPILEGSGGVEKLSWVVSGKDGASVTISVFSDSIDKVSTEVSLKGGVQ